MSYNVFLWGFDSKLVRSVIVRLEQDGIINISKWFIREEFINEEFFVKRTEVEPYWVYKFTKNDNNEDTLLSITYPSKQISDNMQQHMLMILHNLTRYTDAFRIPLHESLNIINQLINRYHSILSEKQPSIVIFADVPHMVDGTVLYFLAKAMNVKTLIFAATPFEKKVTYFFSLSDYGKFQDVPVYNQQTEENYIIEEKFEKNLPYMTEAQIKHDMGLDKMWSYRLRVFHSPAKWCQERIEVLRKSFSKYESLNEFLEIKLIKLINKHFLEKNYQSRLRKLSTNICDFNQPYVYFPLHLQPEMTTDTLGGIYTDQLLALEQLRSKLPENWKIYVKENPKQKSYKRGKEFFERLSSIPNTLLLDRTVDTYKLTASSKFVATITGTAAWEAVSGGKPALVFGHHWYDKLPGIFHYSDDINAEDIANFHINHEKLESKVAECMKKMAVLVLYDEMLLGVKEFNKTENENNVYEFFKFILPYVK